MQKNSRTLESNHVNRNAGKDKTPDTPTNNVLLQSEARFRLMVESVTDYAIFMLDPKGNVASWNAGAERIKGYRAAEIIGRHFSTFYPESDLTTGKPQHELEVAEAAGRFEEEGWRLRKDGSSFWANVVITALRDETGALTGFAKVTRDLTERRRTELELVEAKITAEKASDAKSDFLARMSHELRTPLNSMLILAELLADNPDNNLNAKEVKYAQTVHEAGLDLLSMINDLLDLARIESRVTNPLDVTAVKWPRLRAYLEANFGQLAKKKNLQFDIIVESSLPEQIHTDKKRLQQILKNLLANAFKFTREGGVSVRMAPVQSGWSSGHVSLDTASQVIAFSVSDTGIGVPEDKQKIIFEAFQQADGSTTREYGGTGLGLSISRELTRMLGGEIRLSSETGKGSVFTLYLPMSPSNASVRSPV